jgi:dienelactone hydrolase
MKNIIIVAGAPWAVSHFKQAGHTVLLAETPEEIDALSDLIETHPQLCELRVGAFGAGRGANAVLTACASRPWGIGAAVVMDPTQGPFERVRVPTLIQLTHDDVEVLRATREAYSRLHEYCDVMVPDDEDDAVHLALAWFERHLGHAQAEPGYDREPPSVAFDT